MNRHISTKKRNLRIRSALLYRSLHANPLCKVLLFYFQVQFYHIRSDYLLITINIFLLNICRILQLTFNVKSYFSIKVCSFENISVQNILMWTFNKPLSDWEGKCQNLHFWRIEKRWYFPHSYSVEAFRMRRLYRM